jgi:hypothetical protein
MFIRVFAISLVTTPNMLRERFVTFKDLSALGALEPEKLLNALVHVGQ